MILIFAPLMWMCWLDVFAWPDLPSPEQDK